MSIKLRLSAARPRTAAGLLLAFISAAGVWAAGTREPLEQKAAKNSEFVILPVVYRTPETGWAGGLAGQFSIRPVGAGPGVRPSSVQFAAITTENKQTTINLKPEIYLRRQDFVVAGTVEISRYPSYFYGIGPDTPESAQELFTPRQTLIEMLALRRLDAGRSLYAGLAFVHENYRFISFSPEGALIRGQIPGSRGGSFTGLGFGFRWDGRDNVFFPRRGPFWQVSAVRMGGLVGGDFAFTRVKADLRQYTPLGTGPVLALQIRFEAAAGADMPFMALPKMGGESLMRGYYAGRYRDRVLAALQAECRLPISGRLGAVVFAGIGRVAPALTALGDGPPRLSAGAGLRFRISDEGTNLRMDVGWGHGAPGVYFTAGEAF